MNIDYGKLVKLLRLTQSDNDAEALAAIRAANRELKRVGLEWHNIIVVTPQAYHAQAADMFAQAAESVRAQRGAQWRENVRAAQAARDAQYTNERVNNEYSSGWTHKGPGENVYWNDGNMYARSEAPPSDDEVALAQCAVIADESAKTNWYCFACMEPELAQFVFDQREISWIARALFSTICQHGELNDTQLAVLRQRVKNNGRGNANAT